MRYFRITSPTVPVAVVAAVLAFSPAAAQTQSQTGGPVSLDETAARSVARIAVIDNRQVRDPGPADFEITSLLIGAAQRLSPGDAELIRMRLTAAITGGDQEISIAQTRLLIAVNPNDTVAQLRLISHIINQQQTVDGRIELVERFLGEAGAKIPVEVRSRLALDAALWSRDHGNDEDFVRYLVMATTLDSSNKLAAYMAANYYAATIDEPVGQLELLVNLLLADPLDLQTHVAIATELARYGAFEQALRFQANAITIGLSDPEFNADHIVQNQIILVWHVDGPAAVVAILNDRLAQARDAIARQLREAEAAGQLVIDPPDPGDQNLSFADERIRLLAANASEDSATAAAAVAALRTTIPQYLDAMLENEVPADQIDQMRKVLETEFVLTRLWVGMDVQGAIDDANKLIAEIEPLDDEGDALRLLKAFVAVRSDEPDVALDLIADLEQESIFADILQGLAASITGDVDRIKEVLAQITADQPLDAVGAWALTKLKDADPDANPFGPVTNQVAAVAEGVPSWLDRMVLRPDSFMTLTVEAIETSTRALGRGGLRIRVKNISGIPLGVGPDSPINSQFLVAPQVSVDLTSKLQFPSEVVDGARRLRLAPREELVFDVWPTFWPGSAFVDFACSHTTRMRSRVIQGFVPSESIGYQPGPLCLATDAPTITRTPLAESVMGFDLLIEHLLNDPEEALPSTLAVLMGWLVIPSSGQQPLTPEQIETLGTAAATRFPSLSAAGKSLMLATLPTSTVLPALQPLTDVALEETDYFALPLVMLTRATDPDHAIFKRAAESGDDLVVRLGALLQAQLRAQGYAYSTQGIPGSGG